MKILPFPFNFITDEIMKNASRGKLKTTIDALETSFTSSKC